MGLFETLEIHLSRQLWLPGHAVGLGHDPRLAPQLARQGAAAFAKHAFQIGLMAAFHAAETGRHQVGHLIRHRPDIFDAHCPRPAVFSKLIATGAASPVALGSGHDAECD
jgi:hypothetical protein